MIFERVDIQRLEKERKKKYVDIAWNEFDGGWCRLRDMLSHLHQRSKGMSFDTGRVNTRRGKRREREKEREER